MRTALSRNCTISIKSSELMQFLSVSTMCILIFACIVIITIITITPIIILGLGELQSGQRDLVLYPKAGFLNTTKISNISGKVVMPRFITQVKIQSDKFAKAVFMDFTKEKQHHLGQLAGDQPINHHYVYLHSAFGLPPNQDIKISLQNKFFMQVLANLLKDNIIITSQSDAIRKQIESLLTSNAEISSKFTIHKVFSDSSGKFGIGETTNYVYLDIKNAFQQMINNSIVSIGISTSESKLVSFLSGSWSLDEMASEGTVNFEDRIAVYSNPNYQETYANLNKFSSDFMKQVGIFSIESAMPIAENLILMSYFGMFIGVILKVIIFSLFILSLIMMNNMLLIAVQRKNFDYALFQVMGANQSFIIFNILTSSFKHVIISNLIAYPLAYWSLHQASQLFEQFFGYRYEIVPTLSSIVGGLLIGVLVPIISAIFPIGDILQKDLVQNLNPVRNKTSAINTEIYIDGKLFPWGKLAFGLIATSYGLIIYYLLPRALINQDVALLLSIFFIILQGLLLGLILFSYSFQYILQNIVAYVTLFWTKKVDFTLTLKNLSSHRMKNRKTSILYALSVSFIIFVSTGIQIQLQTIYDELLKKNGSYVHISSPYSSLDRNFYNTLLSRTEGVVDWAYRSQALSDYLDSYGVQSIMVSDKAKLFFAFNQIYAVSPNLANVLYYNQVSVFQTQATEPYDPYSYLYSPNGYMTCTLSVYLADKFNILNSFNKDFYINYYYKDKVQRIPIKYSSLFEKRVDLVYSSIMPRTQIGVSFDTFMTLANIGKSQDIPLKELKIKINNSKDALKIADKLRKSVSFHTFDKVWDSSELQKTIDKIKGLLENVITILLCIVLTISLFSLITTTYINILNQSKEIGILMVCGYSKFQIVKIYIYQSFVLVINSSLLGYCVGSFVAWMIALQRQLFSDMEVQIEANGILIIIIFAVFSSLISTIEPLRQIFKNNINQIINYSQ